MQSTTKNLDVRCMFICCTMDGHGEQASVPSALELDNHVSPI